MSVSELSFYLNDKKRISTTTTQIYSKLSDRLLLIFSYGISLYQITVKVNRNNLIVVEGEGDLFIFPDLLKSHPVPPFSLTLAMSTAL